MFAVDGVDVAGDVVAIEFEVELAFGVEELPVGETGLEVAVDAGRGGVECVLLVALTRESRTELVPVVWVGGVVFGGEIGGVVEERPDGLLGDAIVFGPVVPGVASYGVRPE